MQHCLHEVHAVEKRLAKDNAHCGWPHNISKLILSDISDSKEQVTIFDINKMTNVKGMLIVGHFQGLVLSAIELINKNYDNLQTRRCFDSKLCF